MKISKKWGGNDSAGWPPALVADVGGDRGEGGPGVLLLVLHFFCCLFPAVAKGLIDEGCQPIKRLCFFFSLTLVQLLHPCLFLKWFLILLPQDLFVDWANLLAISLGIYEQRAHGTTRFFYCFLVGFKRRAT